MGSMEDRQCKACGSFFLHRTYLWFTGLLWLQCTCGWGTLITTEKYQGRDIYVDGQQEDDSDGS